MPRLRRWNPEPLPDPDGNRRCTATFSASRDPGSDCVGRRSFRDNAYGCTIARLSMKFSFTHDHVRDSSANQRMSLESTRGPPVARLEQGVPATWGPRPVLDPRWFRRMSRDLERISVRTRLHPQHLSWKWTEGGRACDSAAGTLAKLQKTMLIAGMVWSKIWRSGRRSLERK